jgi:hypothetical protein
MFEGKPLLQRHRWCIHAHVQWEPNPAPRVSVGWSRCRTVSEWQSGTRLNRTSLIWLLKNPTLYWIWPSSDMKALSHRSRSIRIVLKGSSNYVLCVKVVLLYRWSLRQVSLCLVIWQSQYSDVVFVIHRVSGCRASQYQ